MSASSPPTNHTESGPPSSYVEVRADTVRAVVHDSARAWATQIFSEGDTLHEWAARHPEASAFAGRGTVFSIPAPSSGPDARARWAVRHYRRGGAMAMHMEDRYLRVGRPRPFRELHASRQARERGVRTPAVVAGAVYPDGLYYRCDLVTEVVLGVRTLAELLQEHDGTRGWLEAMASAGELIRRLARAGVYHVDLNARNILLEDRPGAEAWVVDLDRARVLSSGDPEIAERMETRLTRSIVKIGTPTGEQLSDREILAALRATPGAV